VEKAMKASEGKRIGMLKAKKFFVFSDSSLDLREVRYFKTKLLGSGVALGVLLVGLVLLVNHFSNDVLGIGYDRITALATENRFLKDQVRTLAQQMNGIEKALDHLAAKGNDLRIAADLSALDEDTRVAAVGGIPEPAVSAFLSGEAATILTDAQKLMEKLSREVKLQQTSYEDITRRMEHNKEFFAHMPAIKPMGGPYSIHGFGMRVHPVLGVYRMHTGVDIIGDVGNAIYAAGDGTVRFAGRTQGGYGVVVEIDHGYGYSTLYAHCSSVLVRPGRVVKRGELIAKSGRSGLVSGPHLHYEVRRNGTRMNPVDYFFDDVDAARYRTLLAHAGAQNTQQ
jgi:murein DD-endopeptidase MepM/ murein hydrolase activator NlpD